MMQAILRHVRGEGPWPDAIRKEKALACSLDCIAAKQAFYGLDIIIEVGDDVQCVEVRASGILQLPLRSRFRCSLLPYPYSPSVFRQLHTASEWPRSKH